MLNSYASPLTPADIPVKAVIQFYLEQALALTETLDERGASVARTNIENALLWTEHKVSDEPTREQPAPADKRFGGFEGLPKMANAAVTRVRSARVQYNEGAVMPVGGFYIPDPMSYTSKLTWALAGGQVEIEMSGHSESFNDPVFLHIGAMLCFQERMAEMQRRKDREAERERQLAALKVASQAGADWARMLRSEILGKDYI